MAKVSEVVAILKKQSDLIDKLRSEKADLLAALRAMRESFRQAPAAFTRHGAAMAQCDAAIERAEVNE